ncbi:MAG: hypothetical protein ACXW1D_00660 [Halobacteriota archaeon]
MFGNGVEQTTTTEGVGALTLSPVVGSPTFEAAFGLNKNISYVLTNTVDGKPFFVEAGIGYMSNSTTFVRARVTSKFVGGSYVRDNTTPVNLVGGHTLIATPHAATLESMTPTIDGRSTGVRRLVTTAHRTMSTTNVAVVPLRILYHPFLFRNASDITALGLNVTTAGGLAKIALFAADNLGYPGEKLVETADIDCSTTGFKIQSVPRTGLTPGWYFTALLTNNGNLVTTAFSNSAANVMGGNILGFDTSSPPLPILIRYENVSSFLMPASVPTTTLFTANAHIPVIYAEVE